MIVDIILLALIALVAFSCKKKGLIKCVMGLISTVLAIILTCVFRQPAIDVIKKASFYDNIYKAVNDRVAQSIKTENLGIINTLAGDAVNKGAGVITESVITSLLSIVLSIVLFIVIILILRIFTNAISSVAKLPVLNFVNSLCGLLWGGLIGLALVYAIFAVWAYFTSYQLPPLLSDSTLAKSMFETNLLLIIFS